MRFLITILVLTSVFIGCKNESGEMIGPKPPAMGVINEIVVIADQDIYDGAVGDSLRYYFNSAYPLMPSPEPMFDLRHFTINDLAIEPLRKELRTYLIIANTKDLDSETTKMLRKDLGEDRFSAVKGTNSTVGKDKWARGQILFYLFADGEENLSKSIRTNFSAIASKVNEHDESIIDANLFAGKKSNLGLISKLEDDYGLNMKLPGDFNLVKEVKNENFVWMRRDIKEAVVNIVMQSMPYTDESQFSKEAIIEFRNSYGKKYISSDRSGSYMTTNEIDLPTLEYDIKIDNQYAKEIRGIWEMENDFKGGPYFTYAIPLTAQGKVVYIDVFILAPGKDKRDIMQQLDYIIKQTKIMIPQLD